MKKLVLSVMASVVSTVAIAQTDTNVNPLVTARSFALRTPAYFTCNMGCEMLIGKSFVPTTMAFRVRASDFGIVSLTLNGTNVISLPKPIYALPLGDGGLARQVYINVAAWTDHDGFAGSGNLQLATLLKDDQISVVLNPTEIAEEIPIDVSEFGSDIRLDIDDFPYGYGYGTSNGKFYVYLSPTGGRYHYILRRFSDGTPIGSGWVTAYGPVITPSASYFGVTYAGNVVGAKFQNPGQDWWTDFGDVSYNCRIPLDNGSFTAGKVIFADLEGGSLEVTVNGSTAVYVQQATEADGDMPLVPLTNLSVPGEGHTRISTGSLGLHQVVITVVPTGPIQSRVWINLHRYYGPLNPGGGRG